MQECMSGIQKLDVTLKKKRKKIKDAKNVL